MTEYRYFMNRLGEVYRDEADGPFTKGFGGNPPYTEVQVVPIDAIVIRRDELPEVKRSRIGYWFAGEAEGSETNPDEWEAIGIGSLAIARHLREHPPADEEQVEELAKVLARDDAGDSIGPGYRAFMDQARRLAGLGVRVNPRAATEDNK